MKCYLILHLSLQQRLLFAVCLLSFFIMSSCTLPRDGWFKDIEDKLDKIKVSSEKISVDTKATAKASQETSKDTKAIADNTIKDPEKRATWKDDRKDIKIWLDERYKVPDHTPAPEDKNSVNWIETLLYVLLGVSGLGGLGKGARFLYKIKPKD